MRILDRAIRQQVGDTARGRIGQTLPLQVGGLLLRQSGRSPSPVDAPPVPAG